MGEVRFSYVPTADMVADILTKALLPQKFELGRLAMGVKAWQYLT